MIFNGGAGLKKTNKGLDVLWNWNKGAGRVTTPVPEGARGRSLWAFSLRGFDLESHQLGLGERVSKQSLPTQVLAGRDSRNKYCTPSRSSLHWPDAVEGPRGEQLT